MPDLLQRAFTMMDEPETRNVLQMAYTMKAEKGVGEIRIYGQISRYKDNYSDSTVTAKQFADDLRALGDVKKLMVYINTPGGSVSEGKAIRSEIMLHKAKEKHVIVTGICASAGTLPACMPRKEGITVSMVDGTTYMIHNPSNVCWGTAADMEQMAEGLHKLEADVAEIYAKRTGKDAHEIRGMMDKTTEMSAQEAVDAGFVDDVIDSLDDETDAGMCLTSAQWAKMGLLHVPEKYILREQTMQAGGEAPVTVSNAAPAATENKGKNPQGKGERMKASMDKQQLMQEQPELCQSLMDEGAANERARMKALDEVFVAPGQEQMVTDAKYGDKPTTAAELCMRMNAAQKQAAMDAAKSQQTKGKAYLDNRVADTQQMQSVEADMQTGTPGTDDTEAERDKQAKMLADAVNQ